MVFSLFLYIMVKTKSNWLLIFFWYLSTRKIDLNLISLFFVKHSTASGFVKFSYVNNSIEGKKSSKVNYTYNILNNMFIICIHIVVHVQLSCGTSHDTFFKRMTKGTFSTLSTCMQSWDYTTLTIKMFPHQFAKRCIHHALILI